MKVKYMDTNSYASDPGGIYVSEQKMKKFFPNLFSIKEKLKRMCGKQKFHSQVLGMIDEHMYYGNCEPAVVIHENPLYIAVYSCDIDCVVLLWGDEELREKYELKKGSMLLSVNTYGEVEQKDIEHGPESHHTWNAVWPIIAEFVSDDMETIRKRKADIETERWKRTYELGREKLFEPNYKYRVCNPWSSQFEMEEE